MRCPRSCTNVSGVTEDKGDDQRPWEIVNERIVYEGDQISVSQFDMIYPDEEQVSIDIARLPVWAAVVLLDGAGGVLLIRRYRFVRGRWGWELPGGQVADDEGPDATAARELQEQAGYRAGHLDPLITFQAAPEFADVERVVFTGTEPHRIGEPDELQVSQRVEWMPLQSVRGLILAGEIWNDASVVGLLSVLAQERDPG